MQEKLTDYKKPQHIIVTKNYRTQRLDNFLIARIKKAPKSLIYRLLRTGQIRVNGGRKKQTYRLETDDDIRIPPIKLETTPPTDTTKYKLDYLLETILYEDKSLLIINKPHNIAVHGGSGLHFGVIEAFRQLKPEYTELSLVHRLDKETSGCLIIAKNLKTLRNLHEQFRNHTTKKIYHAIVEGHWPKKIRQLNIPLQKNQLQSGERIVKTSKTGQQALTLFKIKQHYQDTTILEIEPISGRTHQIRVHCAHKNCPIVGDKKYGDTNKIKQRKKQGYNRLYLHAYSIEFNHPETGKKTRIKAPILNEWLNVINSSSKIPPSKTHKE